MSGFTGLRLPPIDFAIIMTVFKQVSWTLPLVRKQVLPRGLHGLKTEARTRPVPEIVWPDPTRAAQLNLDPEPDPKFY